MWTQTLTHKRSPPTPQLSNVQGPSRAHNRAPATSTKPALGAAGNAHEAQGREGEPGAYRSLAIHHPLPPQLCTHSRTSFLSSILAIISRSSLAFSSLQEDSNLLAALVSRDIPAWANRVVCPLTCIAMRLRVLPLVQVWRRYQGP